MSLWHLVLLYATWVSSIYCELLNIDSYACECNHRRVTLLRHTDSHPLPAQAYKDTHFCTYTILLPLSHPLQHTLPPHPIQPLLTHPLLPIPFHSHSHYPCPYKPHGVLQTGTFTLQKQN